MPKEEIPKTGRRVANLLILTNGKKSFLVPLPQTYTDALRAAARHFGGAASDYVLQTRDFDLCDGSYTEISPDAWIIVKPNLKKLRAVAADPADSDCDSDSGESLSHIGGPKPEPLPTLTMLSSFVASEAINLTFVYQPQSSGPHVRYEIGTLPVKTHRRMSVQTLFEAVCQLFGDVVHRPFTTEQLRFSFGERSFRLENIQYDAFAICQLGLNDGDRVFIHPPLVGGKPVIYLYAPQLIEATVRLSLVDDWAFSAVYPVVPVKGTDAGQQLEWRVQTRHDGTLLELNTGMEVAYLYWEAETQGSLARASSPPPSPVLTAPATRHKEVFTPGMSNLCDEDSVLLAVSNITPYLDAALKFMGLHTEARTSFITYWLPSILKYDFVALRFVEQAAYERAAPLEVTPAPDVVTRVFMLFRGVGKVDLGRWAKALARADEPASRWRDVVGAQLDKTLNASLFRVIEWGGMEVL
ncbi:hypothetical protein EV122DRAFT_217705 [Schizophyllum commune]